jgi:Cu(I)/Ag(I) efflux system membrane protein CusA/SilA
VDVAGRDVSSYVDEASRVVREHVKLPPGYAVLWSGQYEAMARVRARLTYIIPLTLFIVFVLLYLNMRSLAKRLSCAPCAVGKRRCKMRASVAA